MRRIVLIATLSLLSLPASAQMRSTAGRGPSARTSFGSRGSAVSNPGSHFGAGPRGVRFATGLGGGFRRPFFGRRFHHHHQFFVGTWGYYGYPAWGYAYYGDPWFADYHYSVEQPPYGSDFGAAVYGEQVSIEQRLDRIEERVEALLDRTAHPAPGSTTPPPQPEPAASLVFRDGHKEEIQNYGVVGDTLWVFTEQRARKIPLAQLNSVATDSANEHRGVDLHLPKANQ